MIFLSLISPDIHARCHGDELHHDYDDHQVDGVPLPLAPLLPLHFQHPPHRQQHARVPGRPWGDREDVLWLYVSAMWWCFFLKLVVFWCLENQIEVPGYLVLLPVFFVSSHVFLSTTVLITVAITIERYQVVIVNVIVTRGEICDCRHCRQQCKFFASGLGTLSFTF